MSNYATKTDIENQFGTDNVIIWANLDNNDSSTADATRVAESIAWAQNYINDRFRGGPYSIPLTDTGAATPTIVTTWAAKLAGIWLFNSRGQQPDQENEEFEAMMMSINAEIGKYLSGQFTPAWGKSRASAPTAPQVV